MVRINLLPIREILRKRDLKRFMLLSCASLAIVLALMVVWFLVANRKQTALAENRTRLQAKVEELTEQTKGLQQIAAEERKENAQVEEIRKIIQNRDSVALFMEAISKTIPDDIWLEFMEKDQNRRFVLTGKCFDNNSVMSFVEKLQKVSRDINARVLLTETTSQKSVPLFADVKWEGIEAAKGSSDSGKGTIDFKVSGRFR